jgi:hypothetical protein
MPARWGWEVWVRVRVRLEPMPARWGWEVGLRLALGSVTSAPLARGDLEVENRPQHAHAPPAIPHGLEGPTTDGD